MVREKTIFTYKSFKTKTYDLSDEGFRINEDLSFTHSCFKGLEMKGGSNVLETVEMINQYMDVINSNPIF